MSRKAICSPSLASLIFFALKSHIHATNIKLLFSLIHINVTTKREKLKMGQSISGNNGYKIKEFDRIVERCYQTHFADKEDCTLSDFYRAVCETVGEINKKLGSTQFNIPKIITLKLTFIKHLNALKKVTDQATDEKLITREKFEEILQEVIVESGFTREFRVMELLNYILGIPVTALIIKQHFGLEAIPDDLFIMVITSATVFLLAKLHKI